MKYVLDQNMSRSSRLEEFLRCGNEIVITDDFIVEPFKSSDVFLTANLNLEILRDYPDQILVSFDRGELIRKEIAQGRPLTSNQLISSQRTEIFKELLKLVGTPLKEKLQEIGNEAKIRIAYQDDFSEKYIRKIAMKASTLITEGNQKKEYSENKSKRLSDIKEVSLNVLKMRLEEGLSNEHNLNDFFGKNSVNFSYLFTHLWRIVDWAIKGGVDNANKAIKGDAFDIKYILISCFFDEILTKEQWLKECRSDTLSII